MNIDTIAQILDSHTISYLISPNRRIYVAANATGSILFNDIRDITGISYQLLMDWLDD